MSTARVQRDAFGFRRDGGKKSAVSEPRAVFARAHARRMGAEQQADGRVINILTCNSPTSRGVNNPAAER